MDVRFATVVVALVLGLAACGRGDKSVRRPYVVSTRVALVIAVDPAVQVPPVMLTPAGMTPPAQSVDIGRIFGEAVIADLPRDPRIQLATAPPANTLRIGVLEYGFRSVDGGQLTMSVGAELYDSAGVRVWSRALTRAYAKAGIEADLADPAKLTASMRTVAADIANRLRGDLIARQPALIRNEKVVTNDVGAQRLPPAPPPMATTPMASMAPPAPAAPPVATTPAPAVAPAPVPAPAPTPAPDPAPPAYAPPPIPPTPPAPKANPPPAPKVAAGEVRGAVAREGVGLRKQPQRHLPPVQTLPTGTALTLSSRLENEYGIWWYATGAAGKGWILESDVSLQ